MPRTYTFLTPLPATAGSTVTVEVSDVEDGAWAKIEGYEGDGTLAYAQFDQSSGKQFSFRPGYTPTWRPCDGDLTAKIFVVEQRGGRFKKAGKESQSFKILDSGC